MAMINCSCKSSCTVWALVAAVIMGVVTAFLQITGMVTVTPVFLWVAVAIAIVTLEILVAASVFFRDAERTDCKCSALNGLLAGILGTVLLALVLLAVGITATSVISALLVGALLFFFTLALASSACLVRCLADCGE